MSPGSRYPLELQSVSCLLGSGERTVIALDEVSLAVSPGELVAVVGPSGSGKSTLLHVAGLLRPPTSGRVLLEGVDVSHLTRARAAEARRRRIGLVFQSHNLIPTLTLAENIALPLELDNTRATGIEEALAGVGLEGMGKRFPDEISDGQSQLAAIARALIGPRTVLLADEPTGDLDLTTGNLVLSTLRRCIDSGGSGLLLTHDPEVAGWAHRIVRIRDGRLV
ncbi:ABC transporter ATP-binding protein [Corynebacterium comes]|uniref:ABC transporter ATP-binding protein YxdL n=1 Tax=Corynebacterium comes TaxID=2675218 RepID=A0A6B8W2T9_9CORY|nr:ATP-binding cassette domain-containing protein [Corynebacterium comes]QGU04020.1 ABC transporter ATP-binding protein YxdL [Corynebacterium comes]